MRKDEMQLTMSLIPLAMESKRLFPSEAERSVRRASQKNSTAATTPPPPALTCVQARKLAALFGIFAEVLAALRALAQRRHAHLRLAVVTRAAQAGVVPLRREVVALVDHVVLYVDAGLPCRGEEEGA